MKKTVFLFLTLLLLFSLAACSSRAGGKSNSNIKVVSKISGTVRVSLAGWALDNGIDTVTGMKTEGLKDFLKEQFYPRYPNIKIKVSEVPWQNAKAKQTALLKSEDVDVIYTGGAYAADWYNRGLLKNLNGLIQKDKKFDPNDYLQGLWKNAYSTVSPDGKTHFGIPSVLGKRMIVYDKKLFDQWGVAPLSETPSPQEILKKAMKMTGKNPKTGKKNYGLWWEGNGLNDSTVVALTYAFGAKGAKGSLTDLGDIQWKLNSPQMVKVMEWLKKAAKLAPPAFVNGKGNEKFGRKKNDIGIYLDASGASVMGAYKSSKNEKLLKRYQATMNMGPKGKGWVAVDPIVMAKNAKNVKASWIVMKFLTGYQTQKWAYENYQKTPTRVKADFVSPKDKYTKKAMAIAKLSDPTLMDEANPFFFSDIAPAINGFISKAAQGHAPDIQNFLNNLQHRAEKWSAKQKK